MNDLCNKTNVLFRGYIFFRKYGEKDECCDFFRGYIFFRKYGEEDEWCDFFRGHIFFMEYGELDVLEFCLLHYLHFSLLNNSMRDHLIKIYITLLKANNYTRTTRQHCVWKIITCI